MMHHYMSILLEQYIDDVCVILLVNVRLFCRYFKLHILSSLACLLIGVFFLLYLIFWSSSINPLFYERPAKLPPFCRFSLFAYYFPYCEEDFSSDAIPFVNSWYFFPKLMGSQSYCLFLYLEDSPYISHKYLKMSGLH